VRGDLPFRLWEVRVRRMYRCRCGTISTRYIRTRQCGNRIQATGTRDDAICAWKYLPVKPEHIGIQCRGRGIV